MYRLAVISLAFLGLAISNESSAQGAEPYLLHDDLIRGHIVDNSGRSLAAVTVAVTMAPDRITQFAQSDSAGIYELRFRQGTGDYLAHFSAIGYSPFRKRLVRSGSDSVFTVDVVLSPGVQQLQVVSVTGARPSIERDTGVTSSIGEGAAEQITNSGVTAVVPPELRGDLDALALSIPGVSLTNGGISVLGLNPADNSRTLNGLAFNGSSIPKGAITQTRLATTTYDPSRGGFSGAQTQVTLAPGTAFSHRRAFLTLDTPALQVTDAIARHAGVPYTNVAMNFGVDGAVKTDRWVYNAGIELSRRESDAVSMLDAPADVLRRSGVSADSVTRLLDALRSKGAPLRSGRFDGSRIKDVVSFMGRLDRPLFDYSTFTPTRSTWGVVGFAHYERDGVVDLTPVMLPTHGEEGRSFSGGLQTSYSAFLDKTHHRLNVLQGAISLTKSADIPYLTFPDAQVMVSSVFSDGGGGITALQVGGDGSGRATKTGLTWELKNETQFDWMGLSGHRGKLAFDSRLETYSNEVGPNAFGSFMFNSIAELEANHPAVFTRTLHRSRSVGGVWSGAASAGDTWSPSERWAFIYGIRVDGSAITQRPTANPDLTRALGVRPNIAPVTWQLSPRFGFNWYYTGTRPSQGTSSGTMGTFYTVPRGLVRGGVGQFRGVYDPTVVAAASAMSGLPGETTQLQCIGDAVPTPTWETYEADPKTIPSQCAPTSTAPSFSSNASAARFLSDRYEPPRAWRANLSWSSTIESLQFVIDAVYSLNLNQPSLRDINFRALEQFTATAEGGRPVFVPVDAIAAASGAVSAAAGRNSSSYSSVVGQYSDLRGETRQVSVRVRPAMNFIGTWRLDGTYTYAVTRSQTRGFDGATFGDPNAVNWARGNYAPTHQVIVSGGHANAWAALTFFGKISSGTPFTPLVGNDVNGDGMTNDRAFVRDWPANGARGMPRCLRRQINTVAGINSCEGPWTAALNASIVAGGRVIQPLRRIARVEAVVVNLTNPLAGVDQLLHGKNLHGWGTIGYPDPVLYYVRSFDPSTRRFEYELNKRFGSPLPSVSSLRVPFRATIELQFDFGRPMADQQVDRIVQDGRDGKPGIRLDSAAIVRRYCGNLPDWYTEILSEADSLLLSRNQVEQLRAARTDYLRRVGEHWGSFASYLVALPDRFDAKEVVERQRAANDGAWEIARREAKTTLPTILTRVQLRLLPGSAAMLYYADGPLIGIQYFSTGGC